MNKIVVAITGASGSVYAKVLIEKLAAIPGQWKEVGVILTENAREVWKTELEETFPGFDHINNRIKIYGQQDFHAPFAS